MSLTLARYCRTAPTPSVILFFVATLSHVKLLLTRGIVGHMSKNLLPISHMSTQLFFRDYTDKLVNIFGNCPWKDIDKLATSLFDAWKNGYHLFLCGNGGSAANSNHLANDFLYGIGSDVSAPGLKVESLSSNNSVLTCLANDIGYQDIFAFQLTTKASPNDILLVLSGSGNSPNVIQALQVGNSIGMNTFSIVGFSGGHCKQLADTSIHFTVNDMQISEDLQLIVGHMCMQWLRNMINEYSDNQKKGVRKP